MGRFLDLFSKGRTCQLLLNPEGKPVERYRHFKTLLDHNHGAMSVMAELEQLFYSGRPFHFPRVREKVTALLTEVQGLLDSFLRLSEGKYSPLQKIYETLRADMSREVDPPRRYPADDLIISLEDLTPELISMVGAKAGHLGRIKRDLGLPVPEGFALTAVAYEMFIRENSLAAALAKEEARYSPESPEQIETISRTIRRLIEAARIPEEIEQALDQAYERLERKCGGGVRLAVRSSAIGEDTEASFAGQFETVLNVTAASLIQAYKTVVAGKYSSRAILYRYHQGFDQAQTPMCAAVIRMIDPRSSGVMYTRDPSPPSSGAIKISALWGLGEHLVDGSASADFFLIDRRSKAISEQSIGLKETRLTASPQGGTHLEKTPEEERAQSSLSEAHIRELAEYGLKLEEYFGVPQDVEWALDHQGKLTILQSRPLAVSEPQRSESGLSAQVIDQPVLFSAGQTASPGTAAGKVFLVPEEGRIEAVPEAAILVARTASPDYAKWLGKVKGLITDMGSITSHLASVAREFGVPALFDTRRATALLAPGMDIILSADRATVYEGKLEEGLVQPQQRNLFFESPVHRRLGSLLERISPLNLLDPNQPSFSPEGCRTLHDLIRFTHELGVKEMFGLAEDAGHKAVTVRLTAAIPLMLYLLDLGGGLKEGLTTCDAITPEDIESVPMKALWKGLTHPGITWSGAIDFDLKKFMTLMTSFAASELGDSPGGNSYALLGRDYLNFSAKFGYHFATVDVLCGEHSSQNYLALQFSGGAGNYYGRSMRILFLAEVLKNLGCQLSIQGDHLEASLTGYDRMSLEEKLDHVGRLLACSRLLDMVVSGQEDIQRMTEKFFKAEYDFLMPMAGERLEGFYVQTGDWHQSLEAGESFILQDGSKAGFGLSSTLAGLVGKITGSSLQEFLDNLEAYYYFPLAIARNSEMVGGRAEVEVKALQGHIDQAGGLAVGLRNAENYFVLRINVLEDNVILFEYVNNKRITRANVTKEIHSEKWYRLKVEGEGTRIKGYLDDELLVEYESDKAVKGYVGLWTKADSVTAFRRLRIERG